jgi:uncharacterized protein involved in outer membrane biogenesis
MLTAVKKLLLIGVAAGIVLVLVAAAALFYLGPLIKSGVEKIGPEITKVSVKLKSANISLLNGTGRLKGFVLGNPEGFKTAEAVKVENVAVSLDPKSVLGKKVVVRSIRIEAPEITYEAAFGGSNIGKVLENIQAVASREKSGSTNSAGKALQVDEFLITGGKIHVSATVLGGRSATLALPEIRLSSLGQGPDGITPAELSAKAFGAVVEAAAKAVAMNAADISKTATDAAKNIGTDAKDRLKKIGSGVSDLIKSKKE